MKRVSLELVKPFTTDDISIATLCSMGSLKGVESARVVGEVMDWHVVATESCNLHCSYCLNNDFRETSKPTWNPDDLYRLLEDTTPLDGKGSSIMFYGGEPLLNIEFIKEIMERFSDDEEKLVDYWSVTTNGTLLHEVPSKVLQRLDGILVSVDGGMRTTDLMRGIGTYQAAVDGARSVKKKGWNKDLVARMTIGEHSDIYEDVLALHSLTIAKDSTEPLFDNIHWQLNVLWNPDPWDNLAGWIENSYNPGVSRLVSLWLESLKEGTTLGFAPIRGMIHHLLNYHNKGPLQGQEAGMFCRSGLDAAAIFPNGTITACPTAPDLLEIGEVKPPLQPPSESRSRSTFLNAHPIMEGVCKNCETRKHCGGRCLIANRLLQAHEDFSLVCQTIKHLVHECEAILPEVNKMIDDGLVTIEDIMYPKYNNSVEVIP